MDDWKTRVTQIRPVEKPSLRPRAGVPGADLSGRAPSSASATSCRAGRRYHRPRRRLRHPGRSRLGLAPARQGRRARAHGWQVGRSRLDQRQLRQRRADHRSTALRDGDLLKIGNAIFKFLVGGEHRERVPRRDLPDDHHRWSHAGSTTSATSSRTSSGRSRAARATSAPLSLVMFDIDHFKKINDEHGHLAGDYVLRELARRVRTRVRKEEVFARYGGEEFARRRCPRPTQEQAIKVAEDLRRSSRAEPFDFEGDRIPVTISLGVATTDEEIAPERLHQDGRRQPVQGQARRTQPRHRPVAVSQQPSAPIAIKNEPDPAKPTRRRFWSEWRLTGWRLRAASSSPSWRWWRRRRWRSCRRGRCGLAVMSRPRSIEPVTSCRSVERVGDRRQGGIRRRGSVPAAAALRLYCACRRLQDGSWASTQDGSLGCRALESAVLHHAVGGVDVGDRRVQAGDADLARRSSCRARERPRCSPGRRSRSGVGA